MSLSCLFITASLESTIQISLNLNYTVQLLLRSSKFLSIILSVIIFKTEGHENITKKSLVLACMMTLGIFIFHMGDTHKSVSTEFLGLFFGGLSLICDCFVSHYQNKFKKQKQVSFVTLLQGTNFWCFVFSFIYSFVKGEFFIASSFIADHPMVLADLLMSCMILTIGIYFVFFHIFKFGPASLAKVTTVRKCFSVLVSFVAFNHKLNELKVAGLTTLFVVIIFEMIEELRPKQKKVDEKDVNKKKMQ